MQKNSFSRVRKSIHYLILMVSMAMPVGCNDFLDIQPVGRVIPKTTQEYRELLTHAYSAFPEDRGLTTFRSDEMALTSAYTSANDLSSYFDVWAWNDASPSASTSEFSWRSFYQVIFEACAVIENKEKMTGGTTAEVNQLVGEAYMLRAYAHFVLVNLYGQPYTHADVETSKAIPLKLDSDTEKVLERNTLSQVYNSILADIEQADRLLNVVAWETKYKYRFGKQAVNAFRSRVYLYMGDWANALAASEALLAQNGELEDLTTSQVLPNKFHSKETIIALERVLTSSYRNAGIVNKPLLSMYKAGDKRKKIFYQAVTLSAYRIEKGGGGDQRSTFRTGEIYLNAAEAAIRLKQPDKARNHILPLMRHRYDATAYAALEIAVNAQNEAELLQTILDERHKELAFEGHRWFDLRRLDRPEIEKQFNSDVYKLVKDDARYTLPIPKNAVVANPFLQN